MLVALLPKVLGQVVLSLQTLPQRVVLVLVLVVVLLLLVVVVVLVVVMVLVLVLGLIWIVHDQSW